MASPESCSGAAVLPAPSLAELDRASAALPSVAAIRTARALSLSTVEDRTSFDRTTVDAWGSSVCFEYASSIMASIDGIVELASLGKRAKDGRAAYKQLDAATSANLDGDRNTRSSLVNQPSIGCGLIAASACPSSISSTGRL